MSITIKPTLPSKAIWIMLARGSKYGEEVISPELLQEANKLVDKGYIEYLNPKVDIEGRISIAYELTQRGKEHIENNTKKGGYCGNGID